MAATMKKQSKMMSLIHWRLKVTLLDGRVMIGQMLAFDRHMNMVLADCEEFRRVRPKRTKRKRTAAKKEEGTDGVNGHGVGSEDEEDDEDDKTAGGLGLSEREIKRVLGLVVLRGESLNSVTVEGPPPVDPDERAKAQMPPGVGLARPGGRGAGFFAGPPSMQARPMAYGRPPMPPGMPGAPGMPAGMPPAGFPPVGLGNGVPPPPPRAGFPGMPPAPGFAGGVPPMGAGRPPVPPPGFANAMAMGRGAGPAGAGVPPPPPPGFPGRPGMPPGFQRQ